VGRADGHPAATVPLLANFQRLVRYRALIRSLVARDLKARYRGTVFGFAWSFVNPLLYLLVYSFVFTVVMPGARPADLQPYAAFLFCGILPWTWFSSSLLEASNALVAGGNLIRKVLFPAEVLPIVSVLSGLANFCFGLPILVAFLVYNQVPIVPGDLLWLPAIVAVQLLLTIGLALLASALTVHFRDLRDLLQNLLMLWFFATPILYPISAVPVRFRWILELNPFTQLAVAYQETLFRGGAFTEWERVAAVGVVSIVIFAVGYAVFDRLRDSLPEEV